MCSQVRQSGSSLKNFARRPTKCDLRKPKQAESEASPRMGLDERVHGPQELPELLGREREDRPSCGYGELYY